MQVEDDKIDVKDNEFLRQFEAHVNGRLVALEYSLHPRKIFLTKFRIDEDLKRNGLEQKFFKAVFDILVEKDIRVMPTCPDVARFFRAHRRQYRDLLPVGINI